MSQKVDAILEQIERLDETDRLALEQRLGELAEAAWTRDVEAVRSGAGGRGIGQQQIDDAIEELRYGS